MKIGLAVNPRASFGRGRTIDVVPGAARVLTYGRPVIQPRTWARSAALLVPGLLLAGCSVGVPDPSASPPASSAAAPAAPLCLP